MGRHQRLRRCSEVLYVRVGVPAAAADVERVFVGEKIIVCILCEVCRAVEGERLDFADYPSVPR